MSQVIKEIKVKDLRLWTENPRDPISSEMSDQCIADRAISHDGRKRWSLLKLFKTMGRRFDQSEIPTVVYKGGKPVVYDGNRRVLIGKIIHGYVQVDDAFGWRSSRFDFPEAIPCNVCDEETALEHVDRKHSKRGSWRPLERDIFKHEHMKEDKSAFLVLDEGTGIISQNDGLNHRFVKDEIFTKETLLELGFSTNSGVLKSNYINKQDARDILEEVKKLILEKKITTREDRGRIMKFMNDSVTRKQQGEFRPLKIMPISNQLGDESRKTRITKGKRHDFFGKKLVLEQGSVNNVYSDLQKMYKSRSKYSSDFPMVIRMGLRLLVELAATADDGDPRKLDRYIRENFRNAKECLSKDEQNTLATQRVAENTMVGLLQIGAHAYTATNNIDQTIALSLVIGRMLEISHGK